MHHDVYKYSWNRRFMDYCIYSISWVFFCFTEVENCCLYASFSCNVPPDSVQQIFPQDLSDKMAVEKRLAYSIVQFLRDQTHCGSLNSDEQESLEGRSPSCLKHLNRLFYSGQCQKSPQRRHTLNFSVLLAITSKVNILKLIYKYTKL